MLRLAPVLLFGAIMCSARAQAEWLGNAGLGYSYSNNYALQNGNYTNIDQDQVDRSGIEASGGLSWQRLDANGGFGLDLAALVDADTASDNRNSHLSAALSRIQPLSRQWLGRFSARALRYRNDDFTANSYDGASLEATVGWFGQHARGLDLNFSAIVEDHAQNPQALYKTRRLGANAVYFFAASDSGLHPSIALGLQNHDADDDRRDGNSLFATLDLDRIRWHKHRLRLSFSWRQDRYDLAYTPQPGDPLSASPGGGNPAMPGQGTGPGAGQNSSRGNGPGGGFGAGLTNSSGSSPRTDTRLYLSASYQYPFSDNFRLLLNANTGQYSSINGKDSFYNIFSGIRYYFK